MKYEINNLTFIIPIRIDSIIRVENILAVIRLIRSIGAYIIIYEADKYNNHILKRLIPKYNKLTYRFINDYDSIFFRTHYLNLMTKEVHTPFMAIWDADVIVAPQQIIQSVSALMNEEADISFPFNGLFLDTGSVIREHYITNHNIRYMIRYQSYMNYLYSKNFVGGGILVNKEKYINAGGENERFYGWGPEDLDRFRRWANKGYRIHRADGPMFHLTHPRDINGSIRSRIQNRVCQMNISDSTNGLIDEPRI
jgi:predicted glycosyltransferase involved in capsule biosynthesis